MKFLHFGPGSGWKKPNEDWITVDIDSTRGDISMNFNNFVRFDMADESVDGIYASHTFEHVSMFIINRLWTDCCRILKPKCCMRIIVPDVVKSMKEYLSGNHNYELFKKRKRKHNDWTLFECLKADFISQSAQPHLLSKTGLAHQNAWDFETMDKQLRECGFTNVQRSNFQASMFNCFKFEGTYDSEANQYYRSMYVEAIK